MTATRPGMDTEMDTLHEGSGPMPPRRPPTKEAPPGEEEEDAEDMAQTGIVPTKMLASAEGAEPQEGDTLTVRVVKNYGDECEIAVVTNSNATTPEPGGSADEEIEALDQQET